MTGMIAKKPEDLIPAPRPEQVFHVIQFYAITGRRSQSELNYEQLARIWPSVAGAFMATSHVDISIQLGSVSLRIRSAGYQPIPELDFTS